MSIGGTTHSSRLPSFKASCFHENHHSLVKFSFLLSDLPILSWIPFARGTDELIQVITFIYLLCLFLEAPSTVLGAGDTAINSHCHRGAFITVMHGPFQLQSRDSTSSLISHSPAAHNRFGIRDQFCGRHFFHRRHGGMVFGMFQVHYIYHAAADLTPSRDQGGMQVMGSGCKYRWSFALSPTTHLLLCPSS